MTDGHRQFHATQSLFSVNLAQSHFNGALSHIYTATYRLLMQHSCVSMQHSRSSMQHSRICMQHSRISMQHSRISMQHSRISVQHSRISVQHRPFLCSTVAFLCSTDHFYAAQSHFHAAEVALIGHRSVYMWRLGRCPTLFVVSREIDYKPRIEFCRLILAPSLISCEFANLRRSVFPMSENYSSFLKKLG